jgi:hypothetical protein
MTRSRDFDRVEAERLCRIQQCFNADRPTSAEVRSALQRWHLSQIRNKRSQPARAGWVIAGAMLLSGGALAATRVAHLPVWSSVALWTASSSVSPAASQKRRAPCFIERAGRRIECTPSGEVKIAPGEQVTLVVNNVKTELVGPGVTHFRLEVTTDAWVTQFEPRGWAPTIIAPSPPPLRDQDMSSPLVQKATAPQEAAKHGAPMVPSRPGPQPTQGPASIDVTTTTSGNSPDGAWSRAASALRRGDDLAARSALSEISRSPDPAARDAALLAQAQLDLAAGRTNQALPLLSELSRSGATPFIRQRAQEIVVSGK